VLQVVRDTELEHAQTIPGNEHKDTQASHPEDLEVCLLLVLYLRPLLSVSKHAAAEEQDEGNPAEKLDTMKI
jgi:hypothetical protein